jgi:hypothetical protein
MKFRVSQNPFLTINFLLYICFKEKKYSYHWYEKVFLYHLNL